jgi:acetyltransferase-like isoleucine patch superfamily enzyme
VRWVVAFARFWYDFVIGDDWRIAAGIVAVLAVGAVAIAAGAPAQAVAPLVGVALVLVFAVPVYRAAR